MKTKRIILFLSFCLTVSLAMMPLTAFADDSVFTAEAESAAVSASAQSAVSPGLQIEELDGNTIVAATEWEDYTVSKNDTTAVECTFDVRVPENGYLSMYAQDIMVP